MSGKNPSFVGGGLVGLNRETGGGEFELAWERAAEAAIRRPYLDPEMAALKRRVHLELLERWLPDLKEMRILKTDLWEEGVTGDELLFALASRAREARGVDVSRRVVERAERAARDAGIEIGLQRMDIRALPLQDGALDAVISTSTIDHLEKPARPGVLAELFRVLSPGGVLVLTADNGSNLTDPLIRLSARIGAVPFPLAAGESLDGLHGLVLEAGFVPTEHDWIVHGPRVLTTLLVRAARLLPGRVGDRAVRGLLRGFERAGRRWPRRTAAFVAIRAVKPG